MKPSSTSDKTAKSPVAEQSVTFDALNTGVIRPEGSLDADVDSTKAIIAAEEKQAHSQLMAEQARKARRRLLKFAILAVVLLIGLGLVAMRHKTADQTLNSSKADASQRFSNTSIPLASLDGSSGLSVQNSQTLSINGQLNVNNSLVIAPANKPTKAVAGELYFDQTTNQLSYFNGTEFISLTKSPPAPNIPLSVNSLGGASGAVAVGGGLSVNGQTLSNTGVLTLQGQAGNVSLVAGNGIAISGTTLSSTGVLSLAGQTGDISIGSGLGFSGGQLRNTGIISAVGAGTITVTNDGNGNIIIDGPNSSGGGSGTVASPGGTIGKIAKFTGVQTIADSLISDNGTTVTVSGDLSVTGNLNLTNALTVTNGGTGSTTAAGARTNLGAAKSGANSDITSLTGLTTALSVSQGGTGLGTLPTNSVLLGNGSSPISGIAGTNGQCLVMSGSTPTFATCPGSGGVSSIDGLNGVLTIANTTGTGSTITINDAGAASKGIASFNATNFLVTAGAVNTIQDIAVTSTPTFANLNLTNPLGVASGGTGRNSLTSNGVLVGNGTSAVNTATGSNGQCLVISAGAPTFTTCPGSGGVTTVNAANGAITIQGTAGSSVSTVGGVITINDATSTTKGLAAFNSTNFTVSSGTVNTIQDIATTSAPSFGQLSIVSSQATNKMLVVNNTNAAATGNLLDLQLNGTSKLSVAPNGSLTTNGNLSVSGTVTSGLINGQTISSSANFTGTVAVAGNLAVNTIANTGALTVGVGGQSFTLQGNTSSTIKSTNGTNTTTVAFQSPTANVTYNFATAAAGTYDVCTTAGNCVGAGGGVTSSGGTTNKLAKFTGSNTIGDSIITDNGSTVTIAGALSVNTITPTGALTVGATSQNLTLQGAAVTLSQTTAGITNSLVFATPATSNKTITLPNASGTVAVSASGPLVLDSFGNLSCPTCLSGGGGGGSGVSSVNGLSGALTLQGSDAASFSNVGTTITVSDASSTVKGLAKFNSTNLTVTSGSVNTVQDIAVTAAPTFAGLTLSSALTVANGGTGAASASGARTNLGAAASGINGDITQLTGLTTALSVAQGGTGIATTPTNGQILIGNGSGYSLNTLTAGSGVNISNTAGNITISAPGSGTCATCANTALSNLASVAINTSLLPGTAGAADLGSATLPFGQLFLSGTSVSPAVNNFKLTGAATAARTITLPDASGTVAVSASGYLNLSATGNLSFSGTLAVADGGTGANNATGARTNLGAAKSGANSDITSLSGLTTALSVGQGGTGLSTLTSNQLLYATSTSTIGQLTNGSSGLCLISNGPSAAPSFQTCTGAGGVSSVDGLTGALSINNTSGTGSTITINDAAADGITKGIATFNSTNFTAVSGVVNTIQGIATTSTPTFAGLTLNGTLTGNTITPTGAMVVGATAQSLTLQGNASSTITATGGGFTTTLGFSGTPTGSVTYNFDRAAAAGTYTVCTSAGNCLGGGSGGANTALSNLTTTSINQNLIGSSDNTRDLGSSSIAWRNGYFGTGLYSQLLDTASAGTLSIGNTNATTVNIATNAAAHTINIGTNGTTTQTLNIGSLSTAGSTNIYGGGILLKAANAGGLAIQDENANVLQSVTVSGNFVNLYNTQTFRVNDGDSSTFLFGVNGGDHTVNTSWDSTFDVQGAATFENGLTINGPTVSGYTTPGGFTLQTSINIVNRNLAANGSLIALGITSGSDATSRGIIVADARSGSHQQTIGVLSKDENDMLGFSWEGQNVNGTGYIKTLSSAIGIRVNATDVATFNTSGITLLASTSINSDVTVTGNVAYKHGTDYSTTGSQNNVALGSGALFRLTGATAQTLTGITGGTDGRVITLMNAASQAATLANNSGSSSAANRIVTGTGSDYSIAAGSSVSLVYDSVSSVWRLVGAVAGGMGGGSYVSLQGTTPGTADTGNFNVTGTGIAGNLQATTGISTPLLDTSTATTLNIGTTNATSISLNKATLVNVTSTTAFKIQDASSNVLLTADTSTGTITFGTATNGVIFTAATGLNAVGTARHTKVITLTPEYAGSVLDALGDTSCVSAYNGTMTSGMDSTNYMSYYNWTSSDPTAQCYDVVVRVPIPSDFDTWASSTPLTLKTYTSSTSNGTVAIMVRDTAGTVESSCNFANNTPGSTSTWTTSSTCTIAGTYTSNGVMVVRIRMNGSNNSNLRIGDLTLSYKSKF